MCSYTCWVLVTDRLPVVKEYVQKRRHRQGVNSQQRKEITGDWNKHWAGNPRIWILIQIDTCLPQNKANQKLCRLQPMQIYVEALPTSTNLKVPKTDLTQPCSLSCPNETCSHGHNTHVPGKVSTWKGTPSMEQKYILRIIPDGKANGMASEVAHFYQILGKRNQVRITSNIHAQV